MEEVTRSFKNKIPNLKLVDVLVSAFTIFSFLGAMAATSPAVEVIKKAKNLSLQRDRLQATKILRDAIKEPSRSKVDRNKLRQALNKVSRMFFTAKALQEFEMGRSAAIKEPESMQVISHFEEAHSIEKYNTQPLLGLSKEHLRRSQCKDAIDWANKALEINPYFEESLYLKTLSLACLGEADELQAFAEMNPEIKTWDYYKLSLAQAYLLEKQYELAETNLSKIQDSKLPEQYYFKALIKKAQGLEFKVHIQNYLKHCRNREALKKKYKYDPRLCGEREQLATKYQLPAGELIQKVVK